MRRSFNPGGSHEDMSQDSRIRPGAVDVNGLAGQRGSRGLARRAQISDDSLQPWVLDGEQSCATSYDDLAGTGGLRRRRRLSG